MIAGLLRSAFGAAGNYGRFAAGFGSAMAGHATKTVTDTVKSNWFGNLWREPLSFAKAASGLNKRQSEVGRRLIASSNEVTRQRGRNMLAHSSRTTKRAKDFLWKKGVASVALYGAGQVGAYAIRNRAEERRAYMGNQAYDRRYGTGAETAASIVSGAGTVLGVGRFFGVGPMTLTKGYFNSLAHTHDRSLKAIGNILRGTTAQGAAVSRVTEAGRLTAEVAIGMTKIAPIGLPVAAAAAITYPTAAAGVVAAGFTALQLASMAAVPGSRAFMAKWLPGAALVGGAAAVGAGVGMNKDPYPTAEGNIQSADFGSTTSRMNYSTAGLAQSLHKRRHG